MPLHHPSSILLFIVLRGLPHVNLASNGSWTLSTPTSPSSFRLERISVSVRLALVVIRKIYLGKDPYRCSFSFQWRVWKYLCVCACYFILFLILFFLIDSFACFINPLHEIWVTSAGCLQQLQEQCYPFLPSMCAIFLFVKTIVWLPPVPAFGNVNIRTYIDAYALWLHTQGLCEHH